MSGRVLLAIILGVFLAQSNTIYAHGEEEHGEKGAAGEMSARDMKASMAMDKEMETGFIRYDAPTGNSVVLGRVNPQPVLAPEIV
jgi:hypothetical protein